jgi:hypothetical protein
MLRGCRRRVPVGSAAFHVRTGQAGRADNVRPKKRDVAAATAYVENPHALGDPAVAQEPACDRVNQGGPGSLGGNWHPCGPTAH